MLNHWPTHELSEFIYKIAAAENSYKFQKPRFGEENSIKDVIIFGPTSQATLVTYCKGRRGRFLWSFPSVHCNREPKNPPLEKSANKLLTKNDYVR
jgi:hypothetical protein